jgi:hypothetical protein
LRCRKSGATALIGWPCRCAAGGDWASYLGTLRKIHGLQGPIDDAFMDSFVFVRPSVYRCRRPLESKAEQADYAVSEWVHVFRGEPRASGTSS